MKPIDEQFKIIQRGTDEIINPDALKAKLKENRPLIIKAGFDPSAPDIHLGHTVLLRKLKHFQDLGHQVFFLIGDFTGRIGDPSGKSKVRKQLTAEEVAENAKTYKKQIFKILDEKKTKVVFNSHWCVKLGEEGLFDLASRYTVARMLERDDFLNRYKNNVPISILEFLYPLLQGYDSVVMEADVELGGTDQKFNLLVGRALQKNFGSDPKTIPAYLGKSIDTFRKDTAAPARKTYNFDSQIIITMPILEGVDGVEKMSKSLNNYIGINESPDNMFGKIMSISDNLMWRYYELLTDADHLMLKENVAKGKIHPKTVKTDLAKLIVSEYHGKDKAEEACSKFDAVFAKKENPEDMPGFFIDKEKIGIVDLVKEVGFAPSSSEARRLVEQMAVSVNEEKITDVKMEISLDKKGKILKVGKRKFGRIFRA
ncbi:MAG: tyrosine--tRNA ligase [Candidatus Omnitrophica bacterium]|nr:tyrosine--tRNA ligase [Candidatus Omnitrophota bacterium]